MNSTWGVPESDLDRALDQKVVVSGSFRGTLVIPYDGERETRRRENLIANGYKQSSQPTTTEEWEML